MDTFRARLASGCHGQAYIRIRAIPSIVLCSPFGGILSLLAFKRSIENSFVTKTKSSLGYLTPFTMYSCGC